MSQNLSWVGRDLLLFVVKFVWMSLFVAVLNVSIVMLITSETEGGQSTLSSALPWYS